MGSSEFVGYCSFTKAIEHLGDRWSLLIVRELGMVGPQGFNDLATALPGRISRSVLADRLRRLETLGLVSRGEGPGARPAYRLTAVGDGLMATLGSLRVWADTWLPDDPGMLDRDPDIVLGWLAQRVDPGRAPERPVVLELRLRHRYDRRYWLVLQRGVEPYGCLTDPLLDASRYVYLGVFAAGAAGARQGTVRMVGRLRGRFGDGGRRSRPARPGDRLVPAGLGPPCAVVAVQDATTAHGRVSAPRRSAADAGARPRS
ncbi:winged helix-turn-helix transcriptional regulator [Rhodococcus zopfii]